MKTITKQHENEIQHEIATRTSIARRRCIVTEALRAAIDGIIRRVVVVVVVLVIIGIIIIIVVVVRDDLCVAQCCFESRSKRSRLVKTKERDMRESIDRFTIIQFDEKQTATFLTCC